MRINRASDDAAGLAIASSLNADARVFNQAIRNINDGVSMLHIADGALGEMSGIVTRMTELAESSANGIYTTEQRRALDGEALSLRLEYNRILHTTTFNGQMVIQSGNDSTHLQAGYGSDAILSFDLGDQLEDVVADGTIGNTLNPGFALGLHSASEMVDFNGDGHIDVAVLGYTGGNDQVYLRAGSAAGSTTFVAAVGANVRDFEFVDTNGDSHLDILTIDSAGDIIAYAGDGTGSFDGGTTVGSVAAAAFDTGHQLETGDLNGDGMLDILAVTGETLSAFTGNGNGGYSQQSSIAASSGAALTGIFLSDVNNDGNLDFVSLEGLTTNLRVRLGNGDGSFGDEQLSSTGGNTSSFNEYDLVDIDYDGYLDIVAAIGGTLSVMRGNGDGTFGEAEEIVGGPSNVTSATVRDINEDGLLDILVGDANDATIMLGQEDGTFEASDSFGFGGSNLDVADMNGDGALDIVGSLNGDTFRAYLSNTTETIDLARVNLLTQESSRDALTFLAQALESLAMERSEIGSMLRRLEAAGGNLSEAVLNYKSAEGRIVDADIAEETSKMIRHQILQQAGSAVLGQANLAPQLALSLLRNLP